MTTPGYYSSSWIIDDVTRLLVVVLLV